MDVVLSTRTHALFDDEKLGALFDELNDVVAA